MRKGTIVFFIPEHLNPHRFHPLMNVLMLHADVLVVKNDHVFSVNTYS